VEGTRSSTWQSYLSRPRHTRACFIDEENTKEISKGQEPSGIWVSSAHWLCMCVLFLSL
jgi:hypothetical protein